MFAGNGCYKSSVVFVGDSKRIALIEQGTPAPFKGVLITEGRYEELLDYEDYVLSH